MCTLPVIVGLDYSDRAVQVCVLDQEGKVVGNRACANDWLAIVEFAQSRGQVLRAAIESCSGAADLADELVLHAGWHVDLAHPGYVARMKQSPDKTDYQDARLVADLERVGYLPRVWLAPEPIRELRRLVHYRQQLVQQRKTEKLRIRALLREQRCRPPAHINPWTRAWLAWVLKDAGLSVQSAWIMARHLEQWRRLQDELRQVEQRLAEATANDTVIAKLRKQPGIGPVTSWTLRAEIGRFDRFCSGKQLARFCGTSPRNASSGERMADAGLIRAASPTLRATIIEAAHRLIRTEPHWAQLAARLRKQGKPACVAVAAVANRWIRKLYHQMQEQQAA
jgi:transposase